MFVCLPYLSVTIYHLIKTNSLYDNTAQSALASKPRIMGCLDIRLVKVGAQVELLCKIEVIHENMNREADGCALIDHQSALKAVVPKTTVFCSILIVSSLRSCKNVKICGQTVRVMYSLVPWWWGWTRWWTDWATVKPRKGFLWQILFNVWIYLNCLCGLIIFHDKSLVIIGY